MMFFVYHLQTYSPKNRAWKKVIDYVEKYKNVLIKDELSLDALKHEIGDVVNRINAEHPKMKRMQYTASLIDNDRTIRIEAHVISGDAPTRYSFSVFARYVPFISSVRRRICWNRKEAKNEYRNQQHRIDFLHQRNHLDFTKWRCRCLLQYHR